MDGIKTYNKSKSEILNTIYDIIELQNGKMMFGDSIYGKILYQLSMYGYVWQLLYSITELGSARCEVRLTITGERHDKEKELRREFALLDSMLDGGSDIRTEMHDRTIPER